MTRCSICNNLEKRDEDDARAAFDFTPKQLLESVSIEECISCTIILEGIFCFEDETWSFKDNVRLVYAQGLAENNETLSVDLHFCDDRPKLVLEFFYKDRENQEHPRPRFAAIKTGRSASGHPLSLSGLQWVTSNLESCLREHTLCPSNRNVVLPRRILTFNRVGDDAITVRIQENNKTEGRYIALSHCWGSTQTCITNASNLQERKKSIPWTALPKSFQDSIIYSLQLGVHYLWVDALCILQDNPDDWQIESAKMGDIYRNSYLTLAATVSKNGQGGCFPSDQDTAVPKEYELDSYESPTTSIVVREKIRHWIVPPTAAILEHYPLLTRGWTFQERILSTRVIHFCSRELVWECKSQTVCECQGQAAKSNPMEQFSQIVENTRSSQIQTSLPLGLMPENRCFPGAAISEQWHRIVEQYSALNLTKETDRLPALSGLAQRASSALGVYLAGLWSETLVSDLMWRVDKLNTNRGRSTKYVGPSWSWVSVNAAVTYWPDLALHHYRDLCSDEQSEGSRPSRRLTLIKRALFRAGTIHKSAFTFLPVGHLVVSGSKNPFGSISSGAIILLRHLSPVALKYSYTRQGLGYSGCPEVDKQKYDLQIGRIELPFFADYILCEEGPHHIEEFQRLYIMALHPDVCLVLKKTASVVDSLAGSVVSNGNGLLVSTFERVGIVKQPWAFLNVYLIDWMSDARQELVMIN